MIIFTSLEQAIDKGFHWLEYQADQKVHLVERVFTRGDGKLVRALALAKADPAELLASSAATSPLNP